MVQSAKRFRIRKRKMDDRIGSQPSAVIDRLYEVIESRRDADPSTSHTAKLFAKGTRKIAQKAGEEAVELVIEAVRGKRERIVEESADLMYHLLVLWADAHVRPQEVWQELMRREGMSGVAEKAAHGEG
ncbi:MAG: phosphoribosyl-ATP diphosphatase [Alphaproteobacteria bacterium]|nr:phosphoribosyl-ATP diphosphatase [Alphaproteobacteria bacterium]